MNKYQDPREELVTIVDRQNRILAPVTRKEMREKRLIHRATYIIVINSREEILVQRRTRTKDIYPGMWEVAAGGVVSHGEDYMDSAMRELREETGIDNAQLREHFDFYYEDTGNRVWGRVFTCHHDGPVKRQVEEVEEIRFLGQDGLTRLLETEPFTPDSIYLLSLCKKNGLKPICDWPLS